MPSAFLSPRGGETPRRATGSQWQTWPAERDDLPFVTSGGMAVVWNGELDARGACPRLCSWERTSTTFERERQSAGRAVNRR